MFIIMIDSGTTNTRIRIWNDNQIIVETSEAVGVRDTAVTKSKETLSRGVKKALTEAMEIANINESDEKILFASGMITSNVGLCEIPHLIAPVSVSKLADGMVKKILPDICKEPIWFIPGIKNSLNKVTLDNYEKMDIMRGEETETFGIISEMNIKGPAIIILPGSHSKFVKLNENNEIEGCATTIAGEMLDVLTKQTILASSLEHRFIDDLDEVFLLAGANACKKVGLSRSCFSIRIEELFMETTQNQRANFLLGAVLYSDLLTLKNSHALTFEPNTKVIISGKKLLQQALTILIKNDKNFEGDVISLEESKERPLSVCGVLELAKIKLAQK